MKNCGRRRRFNSGGHHALQYANFSWTKIAKAFRKAVEQLVQMDTNTKRSWENLSVEHRNAWIQQVINFYPPNASSQQEIVVLAREEYLEAESLLPVPETCEVD